MAHVLIVDDDQAIRESLRLLFETEGYLVEEATNGIAALNILHTSAYPLIVLLDLRMPRLDGEGVLRAIMNDPHLAHRHAYVLLTANYLSISPTLASILTQLGVPIVPKPFDLDTLLEIVQQLASRLAPPDDSLTRSMHPSC